MVVVPVAAGQGRRFASSEPGPCQAAFREFGFVFAFVTSFQNAKPDGKTTRPDETAKRMMKNT